ncbi:MAG: exo-alpha-sialidase [candidate division KSB1 bacterium]|nr:exo-alpha-sialidase [candidate division KSB1 bacterium]
MIIIKAVQSGLALLLIVLSLSCNQKANELILLNQKTAKGTPIVHMWEAPMPNPDKSAAGFPILQNVSHICIFKATPETGAYNHHSQLFHYQGKFYAMWSNHPHGEDCAGQRVLYSMSNDGINWDSWKELFPPPGDVKGWDQNGLFFWAGGWAVIEDKVYARALCTLREGFENSDGTSFSATRDKEHHFIKRIQYSDFIRRVYPDGRLGDIFPLSDNLPPTAQLDFSYTTPQNRQDSLLVQALKEAYKTPNQPESVDNVRLCEPTYYQAKDGTQLCLLRDLSHSHRIYVSIREKEGSWKLAMPTDIPDSPSLSTTVTLEKGTVFLIGNQTAPKFDNPAEPRHYKRDPLTIAVSLNGYLFDRVFALRSGRGEFRVEGVKGRGSGGGQYPSALVKNDKLYVQYSLRKEDICVSIVSIDNILK